MFVRNVESTWGNVMKMNLLDKLVFPYAVPTGSCESEMTDWMGEPRYPHFEEDENIYRGEEFLIKA